MVGAAEPVLAGQSDEQPPLGFEAHELVVGPVVGAGPVGPKGSSTPRRTGSVRDGNCGTPAPVMTAGQVPSANMWATIQRGLDELLVSPAVKRRAGIELRRKGVDADVVAAGEQIARYKRVLKSI